MCVHKINKQNLSTETKAHLHIQTHTHTQIQTNKHFILRYNNDINKCIVRHVGKY